MVARSVSQVLAPTLLALGMVLTVWSWLLRPEKAVAWALSLVFLVVMTIVLLVTGRSAADPARRSGTDQIRGAIVFAGGVIVLSLAVKIAAVLGGVHDPDLSRRLAMAELGASESGP